MTPRQYLGIGGGILAILSFFFPAVPILALAVFVVAVGLLVGP